MTPCRSRQILTITAIAMIFSLSLFVARWAGKDLPIWAYDMRWILLLIAGPTALGVVIERRRVSNEESFRLGMIAGQSQNDPTNAGTGPQTKWG